MLRPSNVAELLDALRNSAAAPERIPKGTLRVDPSQLNRILEHTAEDMTVTVETGLTLAALQAHLRRAGQWLPIDPPHPERICIADILNENLSGPRRFGYGSIREHLIGIKVALTAGKLVRAGGKVVKNVAGYDLCKLFVGSRGTLAIPVEATFKIQPLPEREVFVKARCARPADAAGLIRAVLESALVPAVLDLHNIGVTEGCCLVAGFAGADEDVQWQLAEARRIGLCEPADLSHDEQFWSAGAPPYKWSVLPSRLGEVVERCGGAPFVARAGNGVLWARGGPAPAAANLPLELMRRIKNTYDPAGLLPSLDLLEP